MVGLRLRLNGDLDYRLGENDCLKLDRLVRRAERVSGDDLLNADARCDVAGINLLELFAVIGVHHQDSPDALGLAGTYVEDAAAGFERAGVNAEEGQLADERVGHDLEGQSSKWL